MATCATPDGTQRYQQRHVDTIPDEHFRRYHELRLSSIGIGTYLGEPDDATDIQYQQAIVAAVRAGCNVIDTAINYRHQRSERAVGAALRQLLDDGGLLREELCIATKGGYVPFEGHYPADPMQYLFETFIQPGLMSAHELVSGCHCLAPTYLRDQLERSLRNLGISAVDLYYLHNPEQQLEEVSREVFRERLRDAFAWLEDEVTRGRIGAYGIATWHGLRHAPNARDFIALEEIVGQAREVGGASHHFRAVQLPYNLAMPEALTLRNQPLDDARVSLFEAADALDLFVVASASLLQGQLARNLPPALTERFADAQTDAQRAIQFARSTPGLDIALVGMKDAKHVAENLAVARTAPLSPEQFEQLFRS